MQTKQEKVQTDKQMSVQTAQKTLPSGRGTAEGNGVEVTAERGGGEKGHRLQHVCPTRTIQTEQTSYQLPLPHALSILARLGACFADSRRCCFNLTTTKRKRGKRDF